MRKMKPDALVKGMFAEVLFVLVVLALCVMAYNGAVHEFQILQKDYSPDMDWSAVLSEELPVVLRNLPRDWLGKWTRAATGHKPWTVTVRDTEGRRFRTQWSQWLETPEARMPPTSESMEEIARATKLDATLACWTSDGFRRWSWLPTGMPSPHVLGGGEGAIVPLCKTVAEYTVYVSTDGAPIELWVAHEGAVPDTVAPHIVHTDPWSQTAETIPWISEVKYVEIKIRPGTAVAIPRHWYVAVRSADSEADGWCWIGEFHTPISRGIRVLRRNP